MTLIINSQAASQLYSLKKRKIRIINKEKNILIIYFLMKKIIKFLIIIHKKIYKNHQFKILDILEQ